MADRYEDRGWRDWNDRYGTSGYAGPGNRDYDRDIDRDLSRGNWYGGTRDQGAWSRWGGPYAGRENLYGREGTYAERTGRWEGGGYGEDWRYGGGYGGYGGGGYGRGFGGSNYYTGGGPYYGGGSYYSSPWYESGRERFVNEYGGYGAGAESGFGRRRANYYGRGPRGYKRSDERIREDVNERLWRDPDVDASDIDVRVEGAEVWLSGVVEDRGQKRRAEDIVEDVAGVEDVHNELKIRHGFLAGLTGEKAKERDVTPAATSETESSGKHERARR